MPWYFFFVITVWSFHMTLLTTYIYESWWTNFVPPDLQLQNLLQEGLHRDRRKRLCYLLPSVHLAGWVHKHFIMFPLNWKIHLMIVKFPVTVQHIFSCIFFKSKCNLWPYHFPPACKAIEADAPTPNHEDGTVSPLYLSCILTHGMCKWWTSTLPLKWM